MIEFNLNLNMNWFTIGNFDAALPDFEEPPPRLWKIAAINYLHFFCLQINHIFVLLLIIFVKFRWLIENKIWITHRRPTVTSFQKMRKSLDGNVGCSNFRFYCLHISIPTRNFENIIFEMIKIDELQRQAAGLGCFISFAYHLHIICISFAD